MKKIIIVLFFVTAIFLLIKNEEKIIIPDKSIRFRIIANSNEPKDQEIKEQMNQEIQSKIFDTIDLTSYEAADRQIVSNLEKINDIALKYDVNYNISYGKNYFPIKEYKGVTYPSGKYQSLVITLGAGLGTNWWCVLFPPLCMLEAEKAEMDNVEYQLYTSKILNKIIH